jgi:hypothetical protein
MRRLLIAASLCAVALLRPPSLPAGTAAASAGCPNFTGTWTTNMGDFQLRGGSGTITQMDGRTAGQVAYAASASTLDGTLTFQPSAIAPNPQPTKIHLDLGAGSNFFLAVPASLGSTPRFHGYYISSSAGTQSPIVGYCKDGGGGSSVATMRRPVKIMVTFHANNLLSFPPSDGGMCSSPTPARITGQIVGQITPLGAIQGSGNVSDIPHLSKCRVPHVEIRVDRIALEPVTPGRTLRATMRVHIDGESAHQPGQCAVGTSGTIVAIYDDTAMAANSSRNDSLQIGPWTAPCNAHNHVITNNITSIPAHAGASTWVTVWIGCVAPGTGYAPRNCV